MAVVDYYLLDYIQSTGSQYIKTGVYGYSNYFADFQLTSIGTSDSTTLWGNRDGADNNRFGLMNWNNLFHHMSGTGAFLNASMNTSRHSLRVTRSNYTFDGSTNSRSQNGSYASSEFYIFRINTSTWGHAIASMRLYQFDMFDDYGSFRRRFIPARRKSDSVAGLYDLQNNAFYTNSGSGSFSQGNLQSITVTLRTSGNGSVSGGGIIYKNVDGISRYTITATPDDGYRFLGWYDSDDNLITTNTSYSGGSTVNVSYNAKFELIASITLNYDSALGNASYSWNGTNVYFTSSPTSIGQFVGWYIDYALISTSASFTYTPTGDITIEARFERIWEIDASVDGDGSISFTRGVDKNDVVFDVIPNPNRHFVKYIANGIEYTNTPLNIHLTQNLVIIAYFEEDERYHITVTTEFKYGSIYISENDVYSGTLVTLWARPFPDYQFVRWQDGNLENPRTIVVTQNVTLVAEYQRLSDTNGIYQYRCFVKDQLDLTATPKAFMVVDTFSIKRDLMTNANSTITVMDMPTNVDEGDVLVLYDPKGTTLYQGVIKSIDVNKITCSQMASFYKGTWIYNVSPQNYLEHELAVLLQNYASGRIYKSSYVDPLVAQRLGGITIDYVGTTSVHLPTDLDDEGNEQMTEKDMEQFIYEIYDKYGIEFEFEINLSGTNYCHIRVPSFETIKVGNNMFAIKDMSPITEIEETNRLIIYSQEKTYRTTYVATKNNIVEAPQSTANRFNITNTTVVFSDDPVADLVASNLPQTMFNHRLTFSLIIKNFIYEFGDFNLGGTLDIYFNDDYYNSVLTGYEIDKASNRNITEAKFICGKVRVKLTQMLTLGKV